MAKKAKVSTDEVKQVINQLVQNFIKEEQGNRVTNNNMSGLLMQIFAAVDGQITVNQPQEGDTP